MNSRSRSIRTVWDHGKEPEESGLVWLSSILADLKGLGQLDFVGHVAAINPLDGGL